MKFLVCGGRDYWNAERVDRVLDILGPAEICQGGAGGADKLAANWAARRGVPNRCFKADWHIHGNAAGMIRNAEMLRQFRPDLVVAFPGGRGTGNMVGRAMQNGVPVLDLREAE